MAVILLAPASPLALATGSFAGPTPAQERVQDRAPRPVPQAPLVPLRLADGSLELRAHWEPLTDTVYHFDQTSPLVAALGVAHETMRHDAAHFRPFLPPLPVEVGDAWRVRVEEVLPLLAQLHPGATQEMHHDGGFGVSAPGGWACLRALDEDLAELQIRLHADFRIDGDGGRGSSSWFTPAQFAGRMRIDRRTGRLLGFQLGVPDQSANVDVNIAREGSLSADIGRVPRMELVGGSFEAGAFGAEATVLSVEEAEGILARRFYPFAALDWTELAEARAQSKASGKPLHVVALFGSLLDESC